MKFNILSFPAILLCNELIRDVPEKFHFHELTILSIKTVSFSVHISNTLLITWMYEHACNELKFLVAQVPFTVKTNVYQRFKKFIGITSKFLDWNRNWVFQNRNILYLYLFALKYEFALKCCWICRALRLHPLLLGQCMNTIAVLPVSL